MELLKMYSGLINSPVTTITSAINATDTIINIGDINAMPDAPNLLILGGDTDSPETVKLISKNGTALTVERAFQGIAQSWDSGTKISRNFTEYDYSALKYNVEVLGARKIGTDTQARREIMDIKLKLDEMEVVDYLNKTGIGFFDLFKDNTNIDTGSTTATVSTVETDVTFVGSKILKMKSETFDNFNKLELAIYDKERESLPVDTTVSNNNKIQVTIIPDSINAGDRFYHKGQVVTVTATQEV